MNKPNVMTLGFDPGRDKCGLAVVSQEGKILERCVVAGDDALKLVEVYRDRYCLDSCIIGNQTSSQSWQQRLQQILPATCPIIPVDERYSSLEARDRYWQIHPPKGLQRLVPRGLRQPPVPIDDLVAVLLIERYRATTAVLPR